MRTFKEDYTTGISSELKIKTTLESFFNEPFTKTSQYHPMDYSTPTKYIEIKTRTNASTTYPTTMIPYSKIDFAKASPSNTYFVFVFTDGIFYIEYDEELFNSFHVEVFQRNPRQDHTDRPQSYLYIPVSLLTKTDDPIQKESV
jgi:hypothetical protein